MKDILAISHERSRTHFFINSAALNFGYIPEQIDVPPTTDYNKLKKFFQEYKPTGKNIVKSHHQYSVLVQFMDIIQEKFKIFYIIRDGRDVMTSCHYYFNKTKTNEFPFTKTVGELMRKNPQAYSFDTAYSIIRSNTMVERWARHILDWLYSDEKDAYLKWNGGKITISKAIINSDHLYFNLSQTINFIAFVLKKTVPPFCIRPLLGSSRSVAPRKGIIGDFIEHFKEHDHKFFFDEVKKVDKEDKLYGSYFNRSNFLVEYKGE